jgi:hypothetical protein
MARCRRSRGRGESLSRGNCPTYGNKCRLLAVFGGDVDKAIDSSPQINAA